MRIKSNIFRAVWIVFCLAFLQYGCAARVITTYKYANIEYPEIQAQKIVERAFYEDLNYQKVEAVDFFDEGIVLSFGMLTNTKGAAVATPLAGGAVASAKTSSITTAVGTRIYYSSIEHIDVFNSKKNNNRFAAYIYHKDGRILRKVYFIGREPALRFVDAMFSLVKHRSE